MEKQWDEPRRRCIVDFSIYEVVAGMARITGKFQWNKVRLK